MQELRYGDQGRGFSTMVVYGSIDDRLTGE
jgi:hypothetical protein